MKQQILKKSAVIVLLTGLTACTPALTLEDRTFLAETRQATEQAKNEAVQAAIDAQTANRAAETAAATASSASEKTGQIYERSQNK